MRAVVLYPNDEVAHLVELPGTDGFTETSYYGIIDRPIDFRRLSETVGMFFDDEFIAKNLPLNFLATVLYRASGYSPDNYIGGPAIVVGVTREGDNADLPPIGLDAMLDLGFTIVQEPR